MFERIKPVFSADWENDHLKYKIRLINPEDKVVIAYDDTPLDEMYRCNFLGRHTHDFYEIEYILSGSGTQLINDREYKVNKGDIVFLGINDQHTYYPDKDTESFGVINCVFRQIPVGLKDRAGSLPNIISLQPHSIVEIDTIFSKMQREYERKEIGYQDVLNAYLNLIFVTLFRESKIQADRSPNPKANMATILDYIEKNYQHVTLKDCADYVSYSSTYFCRLFKDNVGMTLTEYLNQKKIQAAMTLLTETDQSVESIIMNVGFNQRKYFYALFKTYTGMSPCEFRRRNRHKD